MNALPGGSRLRRLAGNAGLRLALLVLALSMLFLMTSRAGAPESAPGIAPAVAAQAATAVSHVAVLPGRVAPEPVAASEEDPTAPLGVVLDWNEPAEGAWHASLRAAATQDGALERLAEPILLGRGPDSARVALLRVLYETRSPRLAECFDRALRTLPDVSTPRGESVPSFAIGYLGRHAAVDAQARQVLERAAFGGDTPLSPGLRRRAAALLAQVAPAAELFALVGRLAMETDRELVNGTIAAIADNADADAARAALARLGRDDVPVRCGGK